MSEPQSVEQVRNGIEKILKTLNLTRIVCVDDTYVVEPPVEVVMVAACSLEKTALKKAFPELEEPIPNDDDVLKEQFRRL